MHGAGGGEHAGRLARQAPENHRLLALSMKYFMGAAMLPKWVGLPRARPSQFFMSSRVQYGAPSSGTAGAVASHTEDTGGTVRSLAWQPGTSSTPRAIMLASSLVPP